MSSHMSVVSGIFIPAKEEVIKKHLIDTIEWEELEEELTERKPIGLTFQRETRHFGFQLCTISRYDEDEDGYKSLEDLMLKASKELTKAGYSRKENESDIEFIKRCVVEYATELDIFEEIKEPKLVMYNYWN